MPYEGPTPQFGGQQMNNMMGPTGQGNSTGGFNPLAFFLSQFQSMQQNGKNNPFLGPLMNMIQNMNQNPGMGLLNNPYISQIAGLSNQMAGLSNAPQLDAGQMANLNAITNAQRSQAQLGRNDVVDRLKAGLFGQGTQQSTIALDQAGRAGYGQAQIASQIEGDAGQRMLQQQQQMFQNSLAKLGGAGGLMGSAAGLFNDTLFQNMNMMGQNQGNALNALQGLYSGFQGQNDPSQLMGMIAGLGPDYGLNMGLVRDQEQRQYQEGLKNTKKRSDFFYGG